MTSIPQSDGNHPLTGMRGVDTRAAGEGIPGGNSQEQSRNTTSIHANSNNEASNSSTPPPLDFNCAWTVGSTDGYQSYISDDGLYGSQHVPRDSSNMHDGAAGHLPSENPLESMSSNTPKLRQHPSQRKSRATSQSDSQTVSQPNSAPDSAVSEANPSLSTLSKKSRIDSNANASNMHLNPNNIHNYNNNQNNYQSLYQHRLFNQPSQAVEGVLAGSCEAMGFDIAEMWLRTGPKTHQLTNSHLRPTALDETVCNQLVDVYYGQRSSERQHRLSPALCKRAKEAMDVVWVTSQTEHGAQALRCSISGVRTAVAIPVCHVASNTNITLIFFSMKKSLMRPAAVEFFVHMSLAAAVASVNSLAHEVMPESPSPDQFNLARRGMQMNMNMNMPNNSVIHNHNNMRVLSHSDRHGDTRRNVMNRPVERDPHPPPTHHPHPHYQTSGSTSDAMIMSESRNRPAHVSVTGKNLDLRWSSLQNVEYLTDGGNNWIHTAVMSGKPVVVKTLKPECQDLAMAINEIEGELEIHAKLDHPNIVSLCGAGTTSKGSRFVVLERLDGGTLTQYLGYDTRIRDRRRRFWKKKKLTYVDVLKCAKSIAAAMNYCQSDALENGMILHRDLKPDNIGFTLDGTVKLIDFGLARVVENSSSESDDVYEMSGETGSLRYMAPEVADGRPYNHKADVYSFGIILWELNAYEKPFDGMDREQFYDRVVHGGERPLINKKWPDDLVKLITQCWSYESEDRPSFSQVMVILDVMINRIVKGSGEKKKSALKTLIDRHSTWF